jgi:putative ABC transport system substrate-binding protein
MKRFPTRRRLLGGVTAALAASALAGCAHGLARRRVPTVGFLAGGGYPELLDAFYSELSRLGYAPGRNIHIVQRLTRPNTNDSAVFGRELAAMPLDLVVASALPHALPVRAANPAMPLVIGTGAGLVCNGSGASMERPGGLTTGMDELPPGLTGKRLELLLAAAPQSRRVGLLSTTPASCGHDIQLADAQSAATRLGVQVTPYRATDRDQIGRALAAMVADGQQAFINFQGGLSLGNHAMIIGFADKHRLPAIYQAVLFAEAGGLMTWAPDQDEQIRVAVRMMDKILRGTKPGDIPILHPERYFLTLNRRAAERIGLDFPAQLLASADRVIG